jgi:hypothetical protein
MSDLFRASSRITVGRRNRARDPLGASTGPKSACQR